MYINRSYGMQGGGWREIVKEWRIEEVLG